MFRLGAFLTAFAVATLAASVALAQTQYGNFSVDPRDPTTIVLDGPIGESAGLDFRRIVRANPNAYKLVLNSPGGLLSIGMLIADDVYEAGFSTLIPRGAGCYSACAFIFLAGRTRLAVGNLGVHQFRSERPDQVDDQYTFADIVELLGRFEIDVAVVSVMMRTPPDEIHVFSDDEILAYGINRNGPSVVADPPVLGCGWTATVVGLNPAGDGFLAVRSGPGTQFPEIDRLHNGDLVAVCDERDGWYQIHNEGGRVGWSFNTWLALTSAGRPRGGEGTQLLFSYTAQLGEADHFNSAGIRLESAWQIVRQDRANFHSFGIRDQADQYDPLFANVGNRETIQTLLTYGALLSDVDMATVLSTVVNSTPTVVVALFERDQNGYAQRYLVICPATDPVACR